MALEEKKGQLGKPADSGIPREKAPTPPPQDSSAWGGKPYLKQEDIRRWARSDSAYGKTNLPESERMKIAQGLFATKGDFFKKEKSGKVLKELEVKRSYAKTDIERRNLDKQIKVAKGILGK
jgi:hypothetical protein